MVPFYSAYSNHYRTHEPNFQIYFAEIWNFGSEICQPENPNLNFVFAQKLIIQFYEGKVCSFCAHKSRSKKIQQLGQEPRKILAPICKNRSCAKLTPKFETTQGQVSPHYAEKSALLGGISIFPCQTIHTHPKLQSKHSYPKIHNRLSKKYNQ